MALASAIVFECRTTGSDNNGGAFKTGASGTDRSQQDAAHASGTNLTVHAVTNTKVLPDGHAVVAADIGNVIQITAGASFTAGFYEITAQDGTYWTLDRSPGAVGVTGGTWAMGGAIISPSLAFKNGVAGMTVYVKSGTYTVSSTSTGVANGRVLMTGGANTTPVRVIGYKTTRDDNDVTGRPVLQASGSLGTTNYIVQLGNNGVVTNIEADANSVTINGFYLNGSQAHTHLCKAKGCYDYGYNFPNGSVALATECELEQLQASPVGGYYLADENAVCINCVAYDCTNTAAIAFYLSAAGALCYKCIADTITGTSGRSFYNTGGFVIDCVAYNGVIGFYAPNPTNIHGFINCVAYTMTSYGFDCDTTTNMMNRVLINCAAGNCTTANIRFPTSLTPFDSTVTSLSADPFTDAPNQDFTINNTVGGGASLRGAGYPSSAPKFTATSAPNIGYVDPAAAGSTTIVVARKSFVM